MYITKRTKTKDVIPFINQTTLQTILEEIPPYPLEKTILSMTMDEYFDCIDGQYVEMLLREKKAYKAFGKLKQFNSEMEMINKVLKQNEIKENAEQMQARIGIYFPSPQETILIELCKFFNLKSLEEASKVKVSEWLMVHRYNTSTSKFQLNYDRIMSQKSKQNGKLRH